MKVSFIVFTWKNFHNAVNSTCKLCSAAPETRQHSIGECVFFETERKTYIEKLSTSPVLSDQHILQLQNLAFLMQLTLDISRIIDIERIDSDELGSFELYTREYIFKLHVRHVVALKRISEQK